MKKCPGLSLDREAVESCKRDVQSYQINNNNSLQLRAFLLNETGMFTTDGRQLHGTVTKDAIDLSSMRKVGQGASGEVYFARLHDRTPVALKRIPISSKTHRDEVDRELRFFSSTGDCPFVMKNYGAFWDAENAAIVIPMEWMSYTVDELSRFWKGLDESMLRDIMFQVVSGLVNLHESKRVIHRDLKPSNLLIREDGVVKIADFGVSKLVQTLDVSSTYVGTMYFMAPERLEQGAYSFNSDVWSLGLTMIAIVTGKNPWSPPEQMNLFQLLGKISGDSTPGLPDDLAYSESARDFVRCCLVRHPDLRPSSAEMLKHRFFDGVTAESASANVKMAVEYMTRHLSVDLKKNKNCQRTEEVMAKEVSAQLDKIVL